MDDHESSAAREKVIQVLAIGRVGNVAGLLRVKDQHVSFCELLRGRECFCGGGTRAALVEQRNPLLEEARVIVGAGAVGLRPRTEENTERRVSGTGEKRRKQSEKDG